MDWKRYLSTDFVPDLETYRAQMGEVPDCPHCKAPWERRALVDRHGIRAPCAMRFVWYGITFVEQGLFTYFKQGDRYASKRWVERFPRALIPVEHSGFGCVRVAPPSLLLAPDDPPELQRSFADFWLRETDDFWQQPGVPDRRTFYERVSWDGGSRDGLGRLLAKGGSAPSYAW